MEGRKKARVEGEQGGPTSISSDDDDFQVPSNSQKGHQKPKSPTKGIYYAVKNRFNCVKCTYSSNDKSHLVRHLKIHEKPTKPSRPEVFECANCKYKATKKSHWVQHLSSSKHQSLHNSTVSGRTFPCPELDCAFSANRMQTLYLHLSSVHQKIIDQEILEFENEDKFKEWKSSLQTTVCSKYVKRPSDSKTQLYICHRSGFFEAKEDRTRELKKIGTVKCGRICASRLRVTKHETGVKVEYWKTHTGHDIEPGKVGIASPQKQVLAVSLKQGIPKHRIIQNIQQTHSGNITPISLVTNQDLVNIGKKSKHIRLDTNDAKSIHLKYLEMKNAGDNSIFFYKSCGEVSAEYPSLNDADFVLAYMNQGQAHMLKTSGQRLLCIDSTHGTNSYGFEMTTLMTTDDEFEGFPLVFFFHSSKSQETYTAFFQALRHEVGIIQTDTFMSDDEPAFYNAWKTVMGPANKKLLCSWHVLHNWSKKLSCLNKLNKIKLLSELQVVMQELHQADFELAFKNLLQKIESDSVFSQLHSYFKYYWSRKEEWAYCYRNHAGINTNMRLENMHKEIKYKYLKGKKVRRLDEGLNAVLDYLHQRQFDRIITDYRGKVTTKDHALRVAHGRSKNISPDYITKVGNSWMCQSFSSATITYNLWKVVDQCNCQTRCSKCDTCIQIYRCSCLENAIRYNMCKHIHLLCKYLSQDQQAESSDEDHDLVVDTDAFTEQRHEEMQFHLLDLNRNSTNFDSRYSSETVKEQLQKALDLATNKEDYKILHKYLSEAIEQIKLRKSALESFPISQQCQQQPGNTNVERQMRFISKKRKSYHIRKPDHVSRQEIMNELLPLRLQTDSHCSPPVNQVVNQLYMDVDIPCENEMEIEVN